MEYNWVPCIITTDFEKALISIYREQNSWVVFSFETSHQKEVNKIKNIPPKHDNYSYLNGIVYSNIL
ncbi:hypothetical protein HZS_2061 [Henneguya salminicola]|nr:hypothetical protein HZS_2061 [Henneguya salminicola]